MTTVCFDRKTLAADTMSVAGTLRGVEHKLHTILSGNFVLAGAGEWWRILDVVDWIKGRNDFHKQPNEWDRWPGFKDNNDDPGAILVCLKTIDGAPYKCGEAWYLEGPRWEPLNRPFYAIGSGKQFAMGAMAHGATAVEALRVAHLLDCYTGGDIDQQEVDAQ